MTDKTKYFSHAAAFFAVVLIAAVLATGCGKKKPKPQVDIGHGNFPTDSMTDDWAMNGEQTGMDGTMTGEAVNQEGAVAGTVAERLGGESAAAGAPVPELPPVYFAYDSDGLDQAAKAVLDKSIEYLRANTGLQAVLRGHTDERGTEEYNVSLGSRRAQSVRDYLVFNGIKADRLQTLSFGESMPATDQTDDASRARNRRVEFFVYTMEE